MAASSGLFLASMYNQSQLAERKHVARYWSINTAATAVPLSAHPSPLSCVYTMQPRCTTGCTTGCIVYTDIFLVVQPVVQRVASCIRGFSYYNEISGGHIGSSVVRRRGSAGPVLPLWSAPLLLSPQPVFVDYIVVPAKWHSSLRTH